MRTAAAPRRGSGIAASAVLIVQSPVSLLTLLDSSRCGWMVLSALLCHDGHRAGSYLREPPFGAPRIRDVELVQMVADLITAGKLRQHTGITNLSPPGEDGPWSQHDDWRATTVMIVNLVDPGVRHWCLLEAIIPARRGAIHRGNAGRGALVATSGSFGARRKRRAGALLSSDPNHPAVITRLPVPG